MTGASQNSPEQQQAKVNTRVDPLVGTILDGRFQIEDVLGQGGMSVVYKATQLRVNRHVAIKTLRLQLDAKPVYRERFQREISLLCSLSHPNIVTVYDCVIGEDDQPYVVMDYLRGRSLEQLIDQNGPLSVDKFARIAVQVASALDYAHRKGVIHRDLKPGNIVLMDEEMDFVKVVDFGLAKLNLDNRRLTQSGELWGSPPYMSPEQCTSKPEDERSDIYSFGAVMYEMLCGKDPFHAATTVFELIQTHVSTPPPKMSETNPLVNVPPKVEAVVFKAMAKDPKDRYQSGQQLKDAIVEACANSGRGNSGDLLLLPGENKDSAAERWLQDAQNAPPATVSENFRIALDPMAGMSGVENLFAQPGASLLAETDEYGDQAAETAASVSDSDKRWRQPSYNPAAPASATSESTANANSPLIASALGTPAAAEVKTADVDGKPGAAAGLRPSPLMKPGSAGSAVAQGAAGVSPMQSRQALRSRELESKSNPTVMILSVVLILAAAAFGTNFLLHHNDATRPGSEHSAAPAQNENPPPQPAASGENQEPKNKSTAPAQNQASNPAPAAEQNALHTTKPHVTKPHATKPHVSAPTAHAAAVHRTPPAVSQPPAAAHKAGKATPWDALQNLRQ